MKLTCLILLIITCSCVSKKYGLHFQNHPYQYETFSKEKTKALQPVEKVLDHINSPSSSFKKEVTLMKESVQFIIEQKHMDISKGLMSKNMLRDTLIDTKKKYRKAVEKRNKELRINASTKISELGMRKTEPIGKLALIIFGISIVLALAGQGLIFLIGGIAAGLLGLISIIRIASNRKKWKGLFYGIAALIIGILSYIGLLVIASSYS